VVFGALALAALVIVPPYLQAWKAKPKWDAAVDAHNQGRYAEAIGFYKEARALAPDFKEMQRDFPVEIAKAYRGELQRLTDAGQYLEAGKLCEDWLATTPDEAVKDGILFEAARAFQLATIKDPGQRATALRYAREALAKGGGTFSREEIQRFIERLERKEGGE